MVGFIARVVSSFVVMPAPNKVITGVKEFWVHIVGDGHVLLDDVTVSLSVEEIRKQLNMAKRGMGDTPYDTAGLLGVVSRVVGPLINYLHRQAVVSDLARS